MNICGFSGKYRFLSNFYPIEMEIDGVKYKSSEHYYMSQKTTNEHFRKLILDAATGAAAKKIGKTVPLRKDWEEKYKNQSMLRGLLAKFDIPEMRDKLISTGNSYLEETNHWGVCNGVGKNMLGRMLMYVRSQCVTI